MTDHDRTRPCAESLQDAIGRSSQPEFWRYFADFFYGTVADVPEVGRVKR